MAENERCIAATKIAFYVANADDFTRKTDHLFDLADDVMGCGGEDGCQQDDCKLVDGSAQFLTETEYDKRWNEEFAAEEAVERVEAVLTEWYGTSNASALFSAIKTALTGETDA